MVAVKTKIIVAVVTLLALLGGVAYGGSGSSIVSPLDQFGLRNAAYRCMNITALYTFVNDLKGVSPPPWYRGAPKPPAVLTCGSVMLGEDSSTVASSTVPIPCTASLGDHRLAKQLVCSYIAWYRYRTSVCEGSYNGTCTKSSPTVATTSYTATTTLTEAVTVTIIPRRVNSSLLIAALNITGYRVLGNGSALVNASVLLYNLGLGMSHGNATQVPAATGMLLLYNLTVLVDNATAIRLVGYGAPAESIPIEGPPSPSASGTVRLVLGPPRKPTSSHVFGARICFVEDKPEPTRICLNNTLTVPLPFGWRLVRYIADDCRVINETWEVVPANETGYETVLAVDQVKPSITLRDGCIVAAAGPCEDITLRVYANDRLLVSRTARGSAIWCPATPGTYTLTAMDYFNNTATGTFTLTWSPGPPPVLRRAYLGLATAILALIAVLYIVTGGEWPLRGP